MVCTELVICRDNFLELFFNLIGVFTGRKAGTVGHAEDVRINCDRWLAESLIQNDIRGFTADSGQLHQFFARLGDFAAEILDQHV